MQTVSSHSKELKALISLLGDPDKEVYRIVQQNLLDRGIAIVPDLEQAWEESLDVQAQERIEEIIQSLQLSHIRKSLKHWMKNEQSNLIKGAFWVAKYQYPDLDFNEVKNRVQKIIDDLELEIKPGLTPLEKVKIVNHILFDVHHFSRNNTNFHSPQNAYINQVLESKKGNSISLAIIYITVAQEMGLPIYGVNLPKNFILAYKDELSNLIATDSPDKEVLFYINPYNRGAVLGKREIDYFVVQQKLKAHRSFYEPCDNRTIIERLLLNLMLSYRHLGYADKLTDIEEMLKIVRSNV